MKTHVIPRARYSPETIWSRVFRAGVIVAGIAAFTRLLTAPPPAPASPYHGYASVLAWAVAILLTVLGGLYPLRLGQKVLLNLSSAVLFGILLTFPPVEAVLVAFAGTFIYLVIRHLRRDRLTVQTIAFNLGQYLVTWSVTVDVLHRIRPPQHASDLLLNIVGIGAAALVYFFINTWLVTTASAFRRMELTWDTWYRAVRETWYGYIATLLLGAVIAQLAHSAPVFVFYLIPAIVLIRQTFSRMATVMKTQTLSVLEALAASLEHRSSYTSDHAERVAHLARITAHRLGMSSEEAEAVEIAARLHDLGKVAIPLHVLNKPGPLTDEERAQIRNHPKIGAEILRRIEGYDRVATFVEYHHERWDGNGYYGLLREEIPLGARIIAVVDAFDAMVSHRPYRKTLAVEEALAQLWANRGTQFDPRVVDAFIQVVEEEGRSLIPGVVPLPEPVPVQVTSKIS